MLRLHRFLKVRLQIAGVQPGTLREPVQHQLTKQSLGQPVNIGLHQFGQPRPAIHSGQVQLRFQLTKQQIIQTDRLTFNPLGKTLGALSTHNAVRVFTLGQKEKAGLATVLHIPQRGFQGTPCGPTTSVVAIKTEHHFRYHFKQSLHMVRGSGRAQRGNGIVNTVLGQRDHIHVTLNHQNSAQFAIGLTRLVQTIKLFAFVEDGRFGRVQVLWLFITQDTTTKSNVTPATVANGEDDSFTETVVYFVALFIVHEHAGGDQLLLFCRRGGQLIFQVVPPRGGKADGKVLAGLRVQPATLEVVDGTLRLRVLFQLAAVEIHRAGHQVIQFTVVGTALTALFVRHIKTKLSGQRFHRLGKVQMVMVHDKTQSAATGATTKAVVELLIRADSKRRGLLFMKGAASGVIATCLFQFDPLVDHINDINAGEQVINKILGDPSGHDGRLKQKNGRRLLCRVYRCTITLNGI